MTIPILLKKQPNGSQQFQNIGWTIGSHCSAHCKHCYSQEVRNNPDVFLEYKDVDRVVEQLLKLGVKTVNLGGNEPIFTHGPVPEKSILPYIVRTLHQVGLLVGLTTNGISFSYLDKNHPEILGMINDLDFSLDSPFQAEHDQNRGQTLFDLVVKNVKRAKELEIPRSIVTCGMQWNFNQHHLAEFLSLTETLDCEFRVNSLKPVNHAMMPLMPSPKQFFQGFEFLLKNASTLVMGESCISALVKKGSIGCPCGTSSFRIHAKDKKKGVSITPCVYLHAFQTGDLLTRDITEILKDHSFQYFSQKLATAPRDCQNANCDYLDVCRGGCRARAFLVSGSLDTKDPYCPQDYMDKNCETHSLPDLELPDNSHGVRVHENYLCTWIGKVK